MYSIRLMRVDIPRQIYAHRLVLNKTLLEEEVVFHQTSKEKKHNHTDKHLFWLTMLCYLEIFLLC